MADWKNVHLAEQDEKIADLTRRLAECEDAVESERELYGTQLTQMLSRAESAEARVRELVAEAARRPLASDDEQTIADLEAFKARVMEWARGRCGTCGTETESDDCRACRNGYDLEEYPQAAQYADNWTPPQAWEVGE